MITRKKLIEKYIEFFKSKNHKEIKNSSLIPENDPTVLFTTAGMHPLVPFLMGQPHPEGKRLVNVQKCVRTGDIEEVGDSTHHTFFEMLGNWSLADYGKKQAIEWSFEFLTKELEIPKEELEITCFKGDENAPADIESEKTWKSLGIKKIKFLNKKENWWGPAGEVGPCGPDTEMFVKGIEIWNDVFMEYEKTKEGKYLEAKQKNIDTGMGVERVLAILNGLEDSYLSEAWNPIISEIEKISNKNYSENKKEMRIIADHLKAACFIINDGIYPGNSEHGYVLRRLIRGAIRNLKKLDIEINQTISKIAKKVFEIYPEYNLNKEKIFEELKKEEEKFMKTLEKGLKIFEKKNMKVKIATPLKLENNLNKKNSQKKEEQNLPVKSEKYISGEDAFLLYQSYGFPIEMTIEIAKEKGMTVDLEGYKKAKKKHQELSQTASKGRFKSGLADDSIATTKLHTAAHLLLEALKKVLGNQIEQKGSNINPERLRFDFSFDRKLTPEEVEKIEKTINDEIKKKQEIVREEMSPNEAKEKGASGIFDEKYGEIVSVYSIGNFSKEICTGPHVKNTSELGKFKISKQESCGAGVRRIKATLK